MLVALSEASTITISIAGLVVAIGLLALLRVIFRKEPSPPSWRRLRIGLFVERDPHDEHADEQPPPRQP
jgi:hypothetical protein